MENQSIPPEMIEQIQKRAATASEDELMESIGRAVTSERAICAMWPPRDMDPPGDLRLFIPYDLASAAFERSDRIVASIEGGNIVLSKRR